MQAMEARRRISSGDSCGGVVGDITNNEERQPVTHSWAGSVLDIDDTLTRCLAICANSDSKYGFLRPVMKFLELSCHGVPWILGSVLAILIAHQVKTQEKLLNLLMALIVDIMVVMITKLTFRRPRPKHNQMDMLTVMAIDGYSFPSGHATRAATVVCFLLSQFSLWPWTAVILLWAIAVPVSRVFLGRHHVLDIVSGVAIGLLQYRYIIRPLWLSSETCDVLLQPIHEELHI